jgi:MFS family permease
VHNPYSALLRVRGGPAFSAAAFVARLPIAMLGIAIVLLVSSTTHRYALAGVVSATFALSGALIQPRLSRLVDRKGQARAVPAQVAVSVAGIVALVVLAGRHAPAWALLAAAVLGGGAYPNVGSLVRARWSKALTGRPELRTAFSFESVLDEVIFVVGPPAVTLLAVRVGAGQALIVAVAFTVVGSAALLVQRSTEPEPSGPGRPDGPSAIAQPGVAVVTAVLTALGGVFGSIEVVTVAFAGQRGEPALAGLLLALYAGGSLCAGVVFGARPPRAGLDRQLVALCLVVPVSLLALPFAADPAVVAVLVFVSGLVVSPTLIASFQLIETLVPTGQLTEGLSWAVTGITFGVSMSAALSGRLVDALGTPHAYAVTAVSGLLTAVVALAGARRVHQALALAPSRG